LRALCVAFFEGERDACESLGLIKDQPDGLSARLGGTPSPHFSCDQRTLDRIVRFTTGVGTVAGGVNVGYTIQARPLTVNQTGIRPFCAEEDAVVRVDPAGACSSTEAGILVFNPLNQ
jgi:hypothetical protein